MFCQEGFASASLGESSRPLTSLVELKEIARKHLPQSSILRKLIESEPDNLDRERALAKMEIFVQLLYEEMKR